MMLTQQKYTRIHIFYVTYDTAMQCDSAGIILGMCPADK